MAKSQPSLQTPLLKLCMLSMTPMKTSIFYCTSQASDNALTLDQQQITVNRTTFQCKSKNLDHLLEMEWWFQLLGKAF